MRIRSREALLAACAWVACLGLSAVSAGCASGRGLTRGRERSAESFSLGWYDSASRTEIPARLAAEGYDLVMPYVGAGDAEEVEPFLDAAEEAGIRVALEIPRELVLESGGAAFREYVQRYARREAVASWYLYDEPEWKPVATPRRLGAAYQRLKELDPGRPAAIVFMFPRLASRYAEAMDELWFDNYPVAAGSREFAAFARGRFADRMIGMGNRAERLGLPLRIVLQGYGEGAEGKPQFGRRLPTRAETRYMLHAALLARPVGILFWTRYRAREDWVQGSLAPELARLRERFPGGIAFSSAGEFSIRGARCDAIVLADGEGRSWLLLLGREGAPGRIAVVAPEDRLLGDEAKRRIEIGLDAYEPIFIEITEKR
jgi:hypothetical protein